MRSSRRTLVTAAVAALIGVAAVPVVAAAAETRYIGPAGSPGGMPCATKATPCPLATALIQVFPDTTMSFAPGIYDVGSSGLAFVPAVHLEPTEPGTRPVLTSATGSIGTSAVTLSGGSTMRGIEIRVTGPSAGPGLTMIGTGSVVREVVVHGGSAGVLARDGTLADAIVTATGPEAAAVTAQPGGGAAASLTIVNVTAVAPDPAGSGILAAGEQTFNTGAGHAVVRNSIAIAGAYGLRVDGGSAFCPAVPPNLPCVQGSLTVDHSLFTTDVGATKGAGNRTGAAGFVDQAAGDLHLRPDSPLIDKGTPDVRAGTADVDGGPRVTGAAIDIGADEYTPPAAPAPAGPAAPASTVPGDTTPPVLGRLTLTRTRFAAGPAPTAISAALRRTPRGTTIDTAGSEPGTLALTLERVLAGRRSGARCVRPTAKLRRAKRCSRRAPAGTLTRRIAAAGPISVAFSGRLGARALPAGAYRLTAVLADAAGNRSAPRQATFTIASR